MIHQIISLLTLQLSKQYRSTGLKVRTFFRILTRIIKVWWHYPATCYPSSRIPSYIPYTVSMYPALGTFTSYINEAEVAFINCSSTWMETDYTNQVLMEPVDRESDWPITTVASAYTSHSNRGWLLPMEYNKPLPWLSRIVQCIHDSCKSNHGWLLSRELCFSLHDSVPAT